MQHGPDSQEPAGNDPRERTSSGAPGTLLQQAVALHQTGRLKEALDLYEAILVTQPDHPVALNLGGVAASQLGHTDRGLRMLQKAAALNPADAKIHNNLGTVLQRLGRVEDAATAFERALVITPDDADLLLNLGNALMAIGEQDGALAALRHATECAPDDPETHASLGAPLTELGRPDEAEAACRRALELKPDSPGAEVHLGNALRAMGRLEEAVDAYRRATALSPRDARAHGNLGLTLKELGRLDEAAASCQQALVIAPEHPVALSNFGIVLKDLGRLDEALAAQERAVAIDPRNANFRTNLGNVLQAMGRADEAVAAHRQALSLKPEQAELHSNLGLALKDLGEMDEALACLRRAVALAPDNAMVQYNLGAACLECGEPEAALAACDKALALDPDHPEAHWNRGLALLAMGRFRDGWDEYEWRWRTKDFPSRRRDFAQSLWDGSPLQGRTILLHAEQGLGDAIQFVRYVPQVAACGGRVVVECQPELARLFQSVAGIDALVVKGRDLPPFDVHAPLLSLPHIFGTEIETIPADVPYLSAPGRPVIDAVQGGGLKVGLVWAGRPTHQNDRNRSIDLAAFGPLLEIPGCAFFSLQVGERRADIDAEGLRGRMTDLSTELSDFADTAAALARLDLLIAVDTSVVHLAGALARPVWTLLPYAADWRWLLERQDSPWYPTMRLFRQGRRGDWPSVLAEVGENLRALLAGGSPTTPR